jgi:hypothetical protein
LPEEPAPKTHQVLEANIWRCRGDDVHLQSTLIDLA